MAYPKGKPRPKNAGRKKGTPNKKTHELQAKLDELGCDPIEGMARIAMDPENPVQLRGKMFAELAQYVIPKRKAIEHTGEFEHSYVMRAPEPLAADEWAKQHERTH